MSSMTQQPGCEPGARSGPTLHLLGDPGVTANGVFDRVPDATTRLLALLALDRRRVERSRAAGLLWPEVDDARAAGNLRTSMWRLRSAGYDLLEADRGHVRLRPAVLVDVALVDAWATSVASADPPHDDLRRYPDCQSALDLLPGWHDDWLVFAREQLRHRVLHALEAVSARLSAAGQHREAIEAALLAVRAEPLRDSAQRALVRAHLAEGNWVEARRACRAYVDLLRDELGIRPASDLLAVMQAPWLFCSDSGGNDVGRLSTAVPG
jgi:DNA-binding SARP family transcriptional activator